MKILGIESTCDETGAAIVEKTSIGLTILSNVVASSAILQKKYGGVVPEVAARDQVKVIIPVIEEALVKAFGAGGWKWEVGKRGEKLDSISSHISHLTSKVDAIAISYGPGLIGSLLIGLETAKALAIVWQKPLIPVNHLVGHIYANFVGQFPISNFKFPMIGLIVSGGHTDLVLIKNHNKFKLIGTTLDDSAGEAFDKVARILGLSYPGGPEIERVAQQLTIDKEQLAEKFPRPMIKREDFDFSFSGLKTAVVNRVSQLSDVKGQISAIASEFQKASVDVLVDKTIRAAQKFNCKSILMGGGVVANTLLRSQMTDRASRLSIQVFSPSKNLSVDNGAMIAAAAFFVGGKIDPLKLQADPGLHF